jgi:hypothetical protein
MNDPLNHLLKHFGESIGLGALAFDATGALGLAVDGQVLGLQRDDERGRLLLYTDLGPLPAGTPDASREMLAIRLLQASLFGNLAASGTLALAPDSQDPEQPLRVVLWRAMEIAALDLGGLERGIKQMVDAAEDWRDALQEWSERVPKFGDADASGPDLSAAIWG